MDDRSLSFLVGARRSVELECPTKDKKDAADTIMQMKVYPSIELFAQTSWTDSRCPDATALTSSLQLRRAQLLYALAVNELIVAADGRETRPNRGAKEIIRAKRVDTHIAAHRHELRARKVVQRQIIVE